jgi:hypothetical protein
MTIDARTPKTPIAPVVKSVEVACAPEWAFELFTSGIGQWWPLLTHSVFGKEAASVVMGAGIGEQIVETSAAGERSSWGTIVGWEPGRSVAFTWHPGLPPEETTDVVVRFTPTARGRWSSSFTPAGSGGKSRPRSATATTPAGCRYWLASRTAPRPPTPSSEAATPAAEK